MPTHLYCLLPADAEPPTTLGAGVRALAIADLVALVADTPNDRLPRDTKRASAEAIEHDRVIGELVARGVTPVPATLADPYASDDDLRADVTARAEEIRGSLARIAGMVEMAVIIAVRAKPHTEQSAAGGGAGRAYLEHLRDLPGRAMAVADSVDALLAPLALASTRRSDGPRVGLSHLIERANADVYRSAALLGVGEDYKLVVDGPRAPYSFGAFSPDRPGGLPPTPVSA